MNEKVSVIITSYNREDMICTAIESVVNQTYKNIEIIVVDDYSKDNTKEIVNSYINRHSEANIKFLINEQNMGANYSRNRGVENSTGKYISFLDDDDEYYPTKIEEQVSLMKKYNDKAIVYCGFNICRKNEQVAQTKLKYEGNVLNELLKSNFLGTPSIILLKSIFQKFGFDNSFPSCQDWDLMTRLATENKFYHTNSILVKVNLHENESISSGPKTLKGFEMYYQKHIKKYTFSRFVESVIFNILVSIKNLNTLHLKKAFYLIKYFLKSEKDV